ncbi:outer membrane protein [Bartonella sp. B30(2025)]
MNIKWLLAAASFAFSVSSVWAADVFIHRKAVTPAMSAPVMVSPTFSWTGSYIGGEIGSFSGSPKVDFARKGQIVPIDKNALPNLSGFAGGFYAGSNIDLGKGFVFGFDTDFVFIDKKNTQTIKEKPLSAYVVEPLMLEFKKVGIKIKVGQEEDPEGIQVGDKRVDSYTFQQKWAGAVRARIGFAAGRVLPYIAGGVAYSQVQNTASIAILAQNTDEMIAFGNFVDEKKSFVGYTVGGGIDLAMTDNVIMRAEYRYSDYGKKKLVRDKYNISYKTNDFRVGIAYKF